MAGEKTLILQRIAEIRARMDPATLSKVEAAVKPLVDRGVVDTQNRQGPPRPASARDAPTTETAAANTVAYDRQTALSAVKVFLETRNDGGDFKRRLARALKKKAH